MDCVVVSDEQIEFRKVYSHPGKMENVVSEYTLIFEKTADFLLPIKINSYEGLGWILIELLNNAVRSPISIAMNTGVDDINSINFFTDIVIKKRTVSACDTEEADVEISVMNRGEYSSEIISSIKSILNGEYTVLDCEERFMLKGSYTGNGGMGILLSKKQAENALRGKLALTWHDGFYDFTIRYKEKNL